MAQTNVNVPQGMCFKIFDDNNPQIQGQYQYASPEYQFMNIKIFKAVTNVTVTTSGSVAYWRC